MPDRNDRCPCGSGKKYKKCCLDKDAVAARAAAPPEDLVRAGQAKCPCGGTLESEGIEGDRGSVIWYLYCSRCEKEWRVQGNALVPFDSTAGEL